MSNQDSQDELLTELEHEMVLALARMWLTKGRENVNTGVIVATVMPYIKANRQTAVTEARMQGWHEGRASASDPNIR